jgi:hypothetical protein
MRIRITAGRVSAEAELNDSPTALAIWEALPIAAPANRWGEEIYFGIPVRQAEAADARAVVVVGELGYWPPGNGFCIFFGRTPASVDDEPRAASPVNPLGHIVGDATVFASVPDGELVELTKA